MISIKPSAWRQAVLAVLLCLAACDPTTAANKPGAADKKNPSAVKNKLKAGFVFYPPAPAPPRVQYLASFSIDADLGGGPGKFSTFLVGKEPPKKGIAKPQGIALYQGQMVVCDTSARNLVIFDFNRKKMKTLAPDGEGQFKSPMNIAIDEEGRRYITDSGRGQVLCFDKDDAYLGAFGDGKEMRPIGIVMTKERIYVADVKSHFVRVFDKVSQKQLFTIPKEPDETNQLVAPIGVALDNQGRLYVSDMTLGRVQVYDSEGGYVRTIGQMGDNPGDFVRPKGVAVDRENRLYVVDSATYVVQSFNAEGKLLMFFGNPKSGAGALALPAGITIDYDNVSLFKKYAAADFVIEHLVLVTSQMGDRKVNVYGFGHK